MLFNEKKVKQKRNDGCQSSVTSRSRLVYLLMAGISLTAIAEEPKATFRRTVYYSGHVQGVGFRAATRGIAQRFQVTGWVKNLDDGRVQLVVEGSEPEVARFLDAVTKRWEKNITKQENKTSDATGEFKTFEVQR